MSEHTEIDVKEIGRAKEWIEALKHLPVYTPESAKCPGCGDELFKLPNPYLHGINKYISSTSMSGKIRHKFIHMHQEEHKDCKYLDWRKRP